MVISSLFEIHIQFFLLSRVESAVAAFLKMYREGAAGSVWLSANNKPGRDITTNVDAAFSELEKLAAPDGASNFDELLKKDS